MQIEFTAKPRQTSGLKLPKHVDEGIVRAFNDAVEFYTDPANEKHALTFNFASLDDKRAMLKFFRAAVLEINWRFRATDNEKDSTYLAFHMESNERFEQRKAQREAEEADREARRAAGEVIKPGRKASK